MSMEWIAVTDERKPENGVDTLFCVAEKNEYWDEVSETKTKRVLEKKISTFRYLKLDSYVSSQGFEEGVTHWMELPDLPPAPEQKEPQ